ncbi:hypothetical protein [Acetobacteroides hydrogenigenes]|uniref:LemA protein n=1 Tax=Acetobacteroides hydrogenigenes TaxID=979970 RepID=A0A4V2RNZ6_9BACT|nr:hypothetical protein [Acetobacteroides hydrogenigenes]TCN65650.1 hypothetical protein CLV25_11039 [Acetobacteroides hydrogenigenes]
MASTSETGHAKNVDNLGLLISNIASYGDRYKPTNPSILLEALKKMEADGRAAVLAVNDAMPIYSRATIERDNAFAPLGQLVTRSLNSLRASSSSEQTDEAASAIVRKIRGNRTTAKTAAATDVKVATVSTSQQSYDSVIDNYERYIQYIAATPEYAPNEDDIKLPVLKALAVDLRAKNTACNNAKVAIDNARMARNRVLYTPLTGLVDVALDAKTYIKSLFGSTSPEYKQVAKIDFTKA